MYPGVLLLSLSFDVLNSRLKARTTNCMIFEFTKSQNHNKDRRRMPGIY